MNNPNMEPAPGSVVSTNGVRTEIIDRSAAASAGKPVHEQLREMVLLAAANGEEFIHTSNTEAQSVEELKLEVAQIKAMTSRRPSPPTVMEVYGTTEPKRPGDFATTENAPANLNAFVFRGSTYDIGALAAGLIERCVKNDRVSSTRVAAYRDWLSYLDDSLLMLEERAEGNNAKQDAYATAQTRKSSVESVLAQQQALEAAITAADIVTRDKARASAAEVATLKAELKATKSGIAAQIKKAVAAALGSK